MLGGEGIVRGNLRIARAVGLDKASAIQMSGDGSQPGGDTRHPPSSTFIDPTGGLLCSGAVQPPQRPGLLAQVDHFEIIRLLGAGGMGLVFVARNARAAEGSDSNRVAIKFIKPELACNPRAVRRFQVEARHMRRLSHPNILKVLEVSDHPDRPYFVMPYLERGSLARAIEPGRPCDGVLTGRVARQMAEALAHAHAKGIIHRDLKPGNVLLDADGNAFLTDFGLARTMFNDSFVDAGGLDQCEGTTPYMSPGVASGEAEDTRCDVYSFGALLYEMLTGRPPYEAASKQEVLRQIRAGPPPWIQQINPSAPRGLARVAESAMGRELRERYAAMADVVEDLSRVEAGREPRGPQGTGAGPRPSGQRKGWRALAVVVVMLGILAGGFWRDWRSVPDSGATTGLAVVRTIEKPGVWNWDGAQPGDWHGVRDPALFLVRDDKLLAVSLDGHMIADWRPPETRATGMLLELVEDLDGDGLVDPLVTWKQGRQVFASVINQQRAEVKRFEAEGASVKGPFGEEWRSEFGPALVVDLEGDGKRELLIAIGTGYELRPRGVYCYDYDSQALRWKFLTAPYVVRMVATDLDGDGVKEIVFGSAAVENGARLEDGTDDAQSYLYAVDAAGRLKWRTGTGGKYSRSTPLLADLDGDGHAELIAWAMRPHEFAPDPAGDQEGRVWQFDRDGGIVATYDPGHQLVDGLVADLDRDGRDEVLISDRTGLVHQLGAGLMPLRTITVTPSRHARVDLLFSGTADLDGDGRIELVLTTGEVEYVAGLNPGRPEGPPNQRVTHRMGVVVLDDRLETVAHHKGVERWKNLIGFSARLMNLDGAARPVVAFFTDRVTLLRLEAQSRR